MEMEREVLNRVRDAIVNLDEENLKKACIDALESGISAYTVVTDGMAKGMAVVGKKYEEREYFVAELIIAGEMMKEGMNILEPNLRAGEIELAGKVVVGTVRGDEHDIGKNIFVTLMKASGFDVTDLGTNVDEKTFIEVVRKEEMDIVGMSALLSTTIPHMETVIRELKKAGLRDKVKVIIGGTPTTKKYAEEIGADAQAEDALEGVRICKKWME